MTSQTVAATDYARLSTYRHCAERITSTWPWFTGRRTARLGQGLFAAPVEKVAENIVEDLLTGVLDWSIEDVNLQIGRADIVLSALGIKRMVLEIKRPGSLTWAHSAVDRAIEQARGYAAQQCVETVAVSDGNLFYAADVTGGGLRRRALVSLDAEVAPVELWWVSVHGIYRACPHLSAGAAAVASDGYVDAQPPDAGVVLHPKYRLPMRCFAYVGRADDPHTWKLPYLEADGAPDTRRLPKAIQAILSNYRGARVDISRNAVGDVLVRLGVAAAALHKMPCQVTPAAEAYDEAHHALEQLGRLAEVACCPAGQMST